MDKGEEHGRSSMMAVHREVPPIRVLTGDPDRWRKRLDYVKSRGCVFEMVDVEAMDHHSPQGLFLIDTALPGPRNGLDLCSGLKDYIQTGVCSVILIDGEEGRCSTIEALETGAGDFLTLSMCPDEWVARINSQLRSPAANQALMRRNGELEVLDAMVETVNRETGFEETLQCLLEQGLILLPKARKGVFLIWEKNRYVFGAAHGYPLDQLDRLTFTEQELTTRLSTHTRQLVRGIYLGRQETPVQPSRTNIPIPKATLAMEVELEGHRGGYLVWDNPDDSAAFDYTDIHRLSRFRGHALSAMARAWYVRELEDKNREITNSFGYARKIQKAMQPRDEAMSEGFPRHFILSMPKSMVSTDFVWLGETSDARYLAVADCAGDGMAGILMSIIGQRTLAGLLEGKKGLSPAQLLGLLHGEIRNVLGRSGEEARAMERIDICLVRFDRRRRKVSFAGARRPLYWIRPNNAGPRSTSLMGDRRPVSTREEANYTTQLLEPESGDMIYLTSDGFASQADENGNKLGVRRFNGWLQEVAAKPPDQQAAQLEKVWRDFKGKAPQSDDITIVGVGF